MKADTLKQQFAEIYDSESDSVFRFCLLRTSDREFALDLTQDTFIRFWNVMSQGELVRNNRALLFKIARNLIIDFYRKKKTVSLDSILESEGDSAEKFFAKGAGNNIEMESEARILIDNIKELEPIYQQVVYLRFVEDMGPKEISEIIGQSADVVSVRINRGVKQLKEIMGYEK